jgi:hypothetical protein
MPKKRKIRWQDRLMQPATERASLQPMVEEYLQKTGRTYFRLPDLLMQGVFSRTSPLPLHWKKHLSDSLSDWPDFLIPRVLRSLPYPILLGLELKSPGKELTKGQRLLGMVVLVRRVDNFEDATAEIERFFAWEP